MNEVDRLDIILIIRKISLIVYTISVANRVFPVSISYRVSL